MKVKSIRQAEAGKRYDIYHARTVQEQLDILDTRPGEAKKERSRLAEIVRKWKENNK